MEKIKHFWHGISENAYHIYILVTLIGVGVSIFKFDDDIIYRVLITCIGVYYIILWWTFYHQSRDYVKKAKYAEVMQFVHQSVHFARDVYRYTEAGQTSDDDVKIDFEKSRFKHLLTDCLTSYSQAFTLVTGVQCRASIKVIGGQQTDMYVKTLVRDYLSTQSCRDQDAEESEQHKILNNTDYKQIFERQIDYFFSNNLSSEGQGYENTSLPDGINRYQDKDWPLPYLSALVWPIRYAFCKEDLSENTSLDKKRDQTLYGFLTIDCSEKDVFDKKYSVEMGAILADALFPIMQSYRKMQNFENNQV